MTPSCIIVTGGAGFIGAKFIEQWIAFEPEAVVNLDQLTYAGNPASLRGVECNPRYAFLHADIADFEAVSKLLARWKPVAVVNFAAESHVDRSIHGPGEFVQTNVMGTFQLLEAVRGYWTALAAADRRQFRFLHVSTDEVYGSLQANDAPFTERTAYAPNSPYAASKAASDHLVRAYHHTYGVPTITTHCSNNYGPYQFPEKLIPLMIVNALAGNPLPVYGDGMNVRDWLYVGDHCNALRLALRQGVPGETYNIGGDSERTNIDVVRTVCLILDALRPATHHKPYESLIQFVADRPGHDRRYAIDATKSRAAFGWLPAETFATGIEKTVRWYLDHPDWVQGVMSGEYRRWLEKNYDKREAS